MNKLGNYLLGIIALFLGLIVFRLYERPADVQAAVGKTYQFRVVNLDWDDNYYGPGKGRCGAKWNLNDANADGQNGWQIVGMSEATYGFNPSYNCFFALEQK